MLTEHHYQKLFTLSETCRKANPEKYIVDLMRAGAFSEPDVLSDSLLHMACSDLLKNSKRLSVEKEKLAHDESLFLSLSDHCLVQLETQQNDALLSLHDFVKLGEFKPRELSYTPISEYIDPSLGVSLLTSKAVNEFTKAPPERVSYDKFYLDYALDFAILTSGCFSGPWGAWLANCALHWNWKSYVIPQPKPEIVKNPLPAPLVAYVSREPLSDSTKKQFKNEMLLALTHYRCVTEPEFAQRCAKTIAAHTESLSEKSKNFLRTLIGSDLSLDGVHQSCDAKAQPSSDEVSPRDVENELQSIQEIFEITIDLSQEKINEIIQQIKYEEQVPSKDSTPSRTPEKWRTLLDDWYMKTQGVLQLLSAVAQSCGASELSDKMLRGGSALLKIGHKIGYVVAHLESPLSAISSIVTAFGSFIGIFSNTPRFEQVVMKYLDHLTSQLEHVTKILQTGFTSLLLGQGKILEELALICSELKNVNRSLSLINERLSHLETTLQQRFDHSDWWALQTEIQRKQSKLQRSIKHFVTWVDQYHLNGTLGSGLDDQTAGEEWSVLLQKQAMDALDDFVQHATDIRFGRAPLTHLRHWVIDIEQQNSVARVINFIPALLQQLGIVTFRQHALPNLEEYLRASLLMMQMISLPSKERIDRLASAGLINKTLWLQTFRIAFKQLWVAGVELREFFRAATEKSLIDRVIEVYRSEAYALISQSDLTQDSSQALRFQLAAQCVRLLSCLNMACQNIGSLNYQELIGIFTVQNLETCANPGARILAIDQTCLYLKKMTVSLPDNTSFLGTQNILAMLLDCSQIMAPEIIPGLCIPPKRIYTRTMSPQQQAWCVTDPSASSKDAITALTFIDSWLELGSQQRPPIVVTADVYGKVTIWSLKDNCFKMLAEVQLESVRSSVQLQLGHYRCSDKNKYGLLVLHEKNEFVYWFDKSSWRADSPRLEISLPLSGLTSDIRAGNGLDLHFNVSYDWNLSLLIGSQKKVITLQRKPNKQERDLVASSKQTINLKQDISAVIERDYSFEISKESQVELPANISVYYLRRQSIELFGLQNGDVFLRRGAKPPSVQLYSHDRAVTQVQTCSLNEVDDVGFFLIVSAAEDGSARLACGKRDVVRTTDDSGVSKVTDDTFELLKIYSLRGPGHEITAIQFEFTSDASDTHPLLAIADASGMLELWQTKQPCLLQKIKCPNPVICLAFYKDPQQSADTLQQMRTKLVIADNQGRLQLLIRCAEKPIFECVAELNREVKFDTVVSFNSQLFAKPKITVEQFIEAAQTGKLEVMQQAYKEEMDILHVTNVAGGWTALHQAASLGCISSIQWLLEHGADVNVKKAEGTANEYWTPLHNAAWNNRRHAIEFLLEAGADYEAKTGVGIHTGAPLDLQGKTPSELTLFVGWTPDASRDSPDLIERKVAAIKGRMPFEVLAAIYGLQDVTERAKDHFANNTYKAENALYGDSWQNVLKTMAVVYRYGSQRPLLAIAKEDEEIMFSAPDTRRPKAPPLAEHELIILGAAYGVEDVSTKILQMIIDSANNLEVSDTIGSDATLGEYRKSLVIVYQIGNGPVKISITEQGNKISLDLAKPDLIGIKLLH